MATQAGWLEQNMPIKGAVQRYGSTLLEPVFIFRSWWLCNVWCECKMWSRSRQGEPGPPKRPQSWIQKDTEDWAVPVNSFMWRVRNQSPGGKTDLWEVTPTKPMWHTPGFWTFCWLNQCYTHNCWSPFLSCVIPPFFFPLFFSSFFPVSFYCIVYYCYYV